MLAVRIALTWVEIILIILVSQIEFHSWGAEYAFLFLIWREISNSTKSLCYKRKIQYTMYYGMVNQKGIQVVCYINYLRILTRYTRWLWDSFGFLQNSFKNSAAVLVPAPSISFSCILSIIFFTVFGRNFVKWVDCSGILLWLFLETFKKWEKKMWAQPGFEPGTSCTADG